MGLVKSDWRILESFFGQYVPYPSLKITNTVQDVQPALQRTSSITSTKSVTFDPVEDIQIIADNIDDETVKIVGHPQVRGTYTKMQRRVFGRVAYQKQMDGRTLYLRFHPAGAWVISDTLEDALEDEINDRALDPGTPSGCAVCTDDCLHPGQITEMWQIFETYFGNYIDCPDMKVKCAAFPEEVKVKKSEEKPETKKTDKQLTIEEIFQNSPEPITVEGFVASNAHLNGTYWKGSKMHENRAYYENNQSDIYLRYHRSQASWIFSTELSKKMNPLAAAKTECYDVMQIGQIWEAPEAFFSKFAPCSTAKISALEHKPQKKSKKTESENKQVRRPSRKQAHGDMSSGFEIAPEKTNVDTSCIEVVAPGNGAGLAGMYLKADDEFNGKAFYKKKMGFITEEDEFTYICWHDSCQWIITTDMTSLDLALAKTIDDTDFPSQVGSPWMVKTEGKFHAEDDFSIKALVETTFDDAQVGGADSEQEESEALDPAEKAHMLSQAPNQIVVVGREGQNDLINGTYNKGFACHEDRVYYTHCDQSCVLRWREHGGLWIFSKTLSSDLEGFAAIQCDAFFPNDIKGVWKFFDHELEEDEGIKITDAKIVRREMSKRSSLMKDPEPFMSHELRQAYKNFDAPEDYPDFTNNKTDLAHVLTEEMYGQLRNRQTSGGCNLDKTIQIGLDTPDQAGSGVLMGDRESFEAFAPLVNGILMRSHAGLPADFHQETDWDTTDDEPTIFDAEYVLSCRAQVDRNLDGYDMPVECSRGNRRKVKELLVRACAQIGGGFIQDLSEIEKDAMNEKRFAFQMNEPSFNCRRDYPEGRAVYLGKADSFSVWINETNHISLVVNEKSGDLKKSFTEAYEFAEKLEEQLSKANTKFSFDMHFGFLNSDPSLGGTGLRLSAMCYFPLLSVHDQFDDILKKLRLKATALGGGKVSITNDLCVGVSENFLLQLVTDGIMALVNLEKTLETKLSIEEHLPEEVRLPWSESATKRHLRGRLSEYIQFQKRLSNAGNAPMSINIFGREGQNNVLNGLYLIGKDKFNGRNFWEKMGVEKTPVYLRWHISGKWIADTELVNRYHGMAFVEGDVVFPNLASSPWMVYGRGRFSADEEVKCTSEVVRLDREHTQGRLRFKSVSIRDVPHGAEPVKAVPLLRQLSYIDAFSIVKQETIEKQAPERIAIVGEHPRALFTNGTYKKVENKLHHDRPVWKKSDGGYNCFLRWHPKGLWIISDFLSNRLGGFALVHDPLATDPTLAKRSWKIQAGGAGYVTHMQIKAVAVDEENSDEHSDIEQTTAKQSSVFE